MTGAELELVCEQINMTIAEFAAVNGFSERTARRWAKAEKVPGPVRAVALAWLQCHRHGVDYAHRQFLGSRRYEAQK